MLQNWLLTTKGANDEMVGLMWRKTTVFYHNSQQVPLFRHYHVDGRCVGSRVCNCSLHCHRASSARLFDIPMFDLLRDCG